MSSYIDKTGSVPEGEIPHWLKPNPINILMVDAPPYFGTDLTQKVVTKLGDTAFLRCKVFNLGHQMVSWLREEPLEIISSGLYTFIRDPRYSVEYMEEDNTWVLRITKVEYEDSAIFDCQVNTDPLMIYPVSLKVVKPDYSRYLNDAPVHAAEPSVSILGHHQNLVKVGSVLNLTCLVTNPPSDLKLTQWIHNDHIVTPKPGLSMFSESSSHITTSSLIIHRVHERDAGTYRCAPGDMGHAIVVVHILEATTPMGGFLSQSMVIPLISLFIISFVIIILGVVTAMASQPVETENCTRQTTQA